jgi:hypothetical protein
VTRQMSYAQHMPKPQEVGLSPGSDREGERAGPAVVTRGGAEVRIVTQTGGMDHDRLRLTGIEHNVDAERPRYIETVRGTVYRLHPYLM